MPRLPSLDIGDLQYEVRIRRRLRRQVDDAGGGDEVYRVDRIDRGARQVLAGNPMDGRVEMRSRMLTHRDVVPIPGRAALVVARDFLDAERRALPQFQRHHDGRKIGRERMRQIDDRDPALGNGAHEGEEVKGGHMAPLHSSFVIATPGRPPCGRSGGKQSRRGGPRRPEIASSLRSSQMTDPSNHPSSRSTAFGLTVRRA